MRIKVPPAYLNGILIVLFLLVPSISAWAHSDAFKQMGIVKPKLVKQAPDFALPDINGDIVSLKDFRGKPVLLNFWATWCEACKKEMPSMERLYQRLKREGFEIVAISIDRRNEDRVRENIKNWGVTFPILLDQSQETRKRYFILGLPTSYLIDAEGKLQGFISGARHWDNEYTRQVIFSIKNYDPKEAISFLKK